MIGCLISTDDWVVGVEGWEAGIRREGLWRILMRTGGERKIKKLSGREPATWPGEQQPSDEERGLGPFLGAGAPPSVLADIGFL